MESINVKGKVISSYYGEQDYQWSAMSLAFKFGADFEKMITPDLHINLGFAYKMALAPSAISITVAGVENTYTEVESPDAWEASGYNEINLGGMSFSLGINYALGELPSNLFGLLEPLKKH